MAPAFCGPRSADPPGDSWAMHPGRIPIPRYALVSIGLISCSMLIYEILLTRICSLRLFFHFGYLIVSNCLLGIGASGSMIAIFQERWRPRARDWTFRFALLYLISLAGSYAFLLTYPMPLGLDLTNAEHVYRLFVFTLVSAIPFFFAGSVLGLILTFNAQRINTVYCVDLLGAGLGCLLTPILLGAFGAGGCMVVLGLLALGGAVISGLERFKMPLLIGGLALGFLGLWSIPRFDKAFPVPGKFHLDLTSEHVVRAGRLPEWSRWSANSRIDLLPVPARQRFMYCLGSKTRKSLIPDQRLIMQDGWAGTLLMNFSDNPASLSIVEQSMYSASLQLKDGPRVLIIGVGGGIDAWAAQITDPKYVRAIELNRQIIDIHHKVKPSFSRNLIEDPRIDFVHGEGRSELMRDTRTYDVVQMTGIDTWTALTSGAYVLAENYLYTREAIESMYRRLADQGILQIVRFSADVEELRLLSNINAAFVSLGVPDFRRSVIVLKTQDRMAATMVKKGVFSQGEQARVVRFANRSGIEVVYLPDWDFNNIISTFATSDDKAGFIADFPRNISPTTDDKPYFFNFYKWRNPFSAASEIGEPSHVAQGNPALVLGQLGLSVVLSFILILLPLLFGGRGFVRSHATRFLVYFVGLGIGFITVEISLMQKLTLFLGHPVYSITVTLFSLLVFTGLGSLLSAPLFQAPGARAWLVPTGLAALLGTFLAGSPWLVNELIVWPLLGRIALTIALLAPIGLLLGIPFAYGIRLLNRFNPTLIPWAWAVNGCCTVIGSILSVVLSMNLGFAFVMVFALFVYFLSFAALIRLPASG